MPKRLIFGATMLGLTAMLVLSAGCGPTDQPSGTPANGAAGVTGPTTGDEVRTVRLYLVAEEKLGVVGAPVDSSLEREQLLEAALQTLLAAPDERSASDGFTTAIPAGTTLHGVHFENGTATADFSEAFQSGGGSLSMQLRVAQVVYTLTQFPDVARVSFEIDGTPVSAIGGEGIVVDPPLARDDCEQSAPPILVESPLPYETATSPLVLRGTANVHEGQFNAKVTQLDGRVLFDDSLNATSGTGTRGAFSEEIEFVIRSESDGTVHVYDISEKDGSETDVVDVPITLRP